MDTEESHSSAKPGTIIPVSYTIVADGPGERLDHFLVRQLPQHSRSLLTLCIKKGLILVNGTAVKASRKLQQGDFISGHVKEHEILSVEPQRVDFDLLFEDEHLLIISKPPNLVVHPASGNPDNTLVNGLMYHYDKLKGVGDPDRPGIVHRLDKDTSGIMVVAKKNRTHRLLVEMFKERKVTKKYFCIVQGVPKLNAGRIVAPIGRHPVNRKKMSIREKDGKYAVTNWHLEKRLGQQHALIGIQIETGRTHQIRVHMASIGHPVAGDEVYGGRKDDIFPRQMLHSSELRFDHPMTGRKVVVKAPLWPDMFDIITTLEESGELQ